MIEWIGELEVFRFHSSYFVVMQFYIQLMSMQISILHSRSRYKEYLLASAATTRVLFLAIYTRKIARPCFTVMLRWVWHDDCRNRGHNSQDRHMTAAISLRTKRRKTEDNPVNFGRKCVQATYYSAGPLYLSRRFLISHMLNI